jgi:excisionase family DNA binding protein
MHSYLRKPEAAELLRCTVPTLERYMRQGVVPYIKIGTGRRATVLLRAGDIAARLNQCYLVSASAPTTAKTL